MKEDNINKVQACLSIVKAHFEANTTDDFKYHNWKHTHKVYSNVSLMADATEAVTEEEKELLQIAALFHDTCIFDGRSMHEQKGAEYAEKVLSELDYSAEGIEQVKTLILATQVCYIPQNYLEEIISDADTAHLSEEAYMSSSFVDLFKEMNAFEKISPKQWLEETLDFFNNHSYISAYAQSNLIKGKMDNKDQLEALDDSGLEAILGAEEKGNSGKKEVKQVVKEVLKQEANRKKKKQKVGAPERGVETVYRVTLRNHVSLSSIADNKANTLISVNAIIISIVLSTLLPKFDNNHHLIIPALTLLIFSILTIIFAIISTIPRTSHGSITRNDVENKKGNLLFFGNFHNMDIDEYEWSMDELLKDRDYLYKSLTRDLYYLGRVLKQKYTYLRISYFTFAVGLSITIGLFIIYLPQ